MSVILDSHAQGASSPAHRKLLTYLPKSAANRPTLSGVQFLAALPVVTAALAAVCVLRPAARRFIGPVVALAAVNVVLTPLTSGEWFYQREEDSSYEQAVTKGDFAAFDRLVGQHDPHLQPRMVAIAVVLLVALAVVAVLHARAGRGHRVSTTTSAVAGGAVLLAAAASAIQGVLVLLSVHL